MKQSDPYQKTSTMDQTKVVRTLRLLESREYNRFKEFAAGHCHREKVLALLDLLLIGLKSKQPRKLSRDYILPALAKATQSSQEELNLNDLGSDLKRLTERYLVWSQVVADRKRLTPAGQALLLERLAGDFGLFEAQSRTLSKTLEQAPSRHSQHYYLRHRLRQQSYFRNERNYYRAGLQLLAESQHDLDVYYLINRYRYVVEDLAYRTLLQTEEPAPDELEHLADQYEDVPPIRIYRQTLWLLHQFDLALYQDTRELFAEHFSDIDELDRHNLYQKFLIILNHSFERGQSELLREIFDLYQFADQRGLLSFKGRVTSVTFLNIVTIGAYLREAEWVAAFIEKHLPGLAAEERPAVRQLSNAYQAYFRKEYAQAHHLNLEVKRREHPSTTIRSRILEFWLYFRDDDYNDDFLLKNLDTFRKYLDNRKDLSEGRKQAFYNFVALARQLVTLGTAEEHLAELHYKVKQCRPLFARFWLMEKTKGTPARAYTSPDRERHS